LGWLVTLPSYQISSIPVADQWSTDGPIPALYVVAPSAQNWQFMHSQN
jgi:hypothetical protein